MNPSGARVGLETGWEPLSRPTVGPNLHVFGDDPTDSSPKWVVGFTLGILTGVTREDKGGGPRKIVSVGRSIPTDP